MARMPTRRPWLRAGLAAGVLAAAGVRPLTAQPARTDRQARDELPGFNDFLFDETGRLLDVPYVPTRVEVVDRMLDLAQVRADDRLLDLGCGDGRIVIRAAQRFGCRGLGIDIDPLRIAEARENARTARVTDLVSFEIGNLFETDLSQASVITMYLLPQINLRLRPRLLEQARPGTRLVSHDFDMGTWMPERSEKVGSSMVYLWRIPPREASPR